MVALRRKTSEDNTIGSLSSPDYNKPTWNDERGEYEDDSDDEKDDKGYDSDDDEDYSSSFEKLFCPKNKRNKNGTCVLLGGRKTKRRQKSKSTKRKKRKSKFTRRKKRKSRSYKKKR